VKVVIDVVSMGDLLNLTPIIRKLSTEVCAKNEEIVRVYCNNTTFLKNNPYCEVYELGELDNDDPDEDVFKVKIQSSNQYLFKETNQISGLMYGGNHLVDYMSFQMGFSLSPKEKRLDYFPDDSDIFDRYSIPEEYIILNPSITWNSRTWSKENWQELIDLCNNNGIFTILVGKGIEDATEEDVKSLKVGVMGGLNLNFGLDLQNKTSLDDLWYLLDKAKFIVCTDCGLLHFSGTTNSKIIMIPGSINPYHRLPFRDGSQDTNTIVVYGECEIFCASNIGYNKEVGGSLLSCPPISRCLEGYDEFKCHSTPKNVFGVMIDKPNEVIDISTNVGEGADISNSTDIAVNIRYENNITNMKDSSVRDTNLIYLTIWEYIGRMEIRFLDTGGIVKDSVFDVSVDSVTEQWFLLESTFENYNDLQLEIYNENGILVYEKVLK
tara:strand:+ start:1186 stop:2496 length:1311 start_codon:yes stop_codon:yes gene_type:complete